MFSGCGGQGRAPPPPEGISVDGNDCGNGMEVKDTLKVPIKPPEAAR